MSRPGTESQQGLVTSQNSTELSIVTSRISTVPHEGLSDLVPWHRVTVWWQRAESQWGLVTSRPSTASQGGTVTPRQGVESQWGFVTSVPATD